MEYPLFGQEKKSIVNTPVELIITLQTPPTALRALEQC